MALSFSSSPSFRERHRATAARNVGRALALRITSGQWPYGPAATRAMNLALALQILTALKYTTIDIRFDLSYLIASKTLERLDFL